MENLKILGISGSPRKNGNTATLVGKALEGAATVPGIETELYQLAGKKVQYCIACRKCAKTGRCFIKDDLEEFVGLYLNADGIIWGVPVYHSGIPASVKAVLDRMSNSLLYYYLTTQGVTLPRLNKVCGIVTGGSHRYGGQDLVLSMMVDHCVHMNGIPVSGDNLMGSYIGAAAYTGGGFDATGKNNVQNDAEGLMCAESVGKRVAEMTRIINAGISALREMLPEEYFYTWERTDSVVA